MSRKEFEVLWELQDQIVSEIKKLKALEQKEEAATKRGQNILYGLSKTTLAPDHESQKAALRRDIGMKQRLFLHERTALEAKVALITDHYVRLTFSLHYVDLMTWDEAAAVIGGKCTGGGLQSLSNRYFKKLEGSGNMNYDSS